jgi:hypothetical protein
MKRSCMIFNAKAGAASALEALRRRFMASSPCEFRSTADGHDVKTQVQSAVEQGAQRIIVAGGDGTVSRAVSAMAADFTRADLAILPLGTGNDLARSVGIPLDNIESALSLALSGESVPMDVVRVFDGKTGYLINAASAGFGGQVAAVKLDFRDEQEFVKKHGIKGQGPVLVVLAKGRQAQEGFRRQGQGQEPRVGAQVNCTEPQAAEGLAVVSRHVVATWTLACLQERAVRVG